MEAKDSANARVAFNLNRLRISRGLSQEALAGDAGIDPTYVSRIERLKENPTVGVLEAMATVLKVDITEFFSERPAGATGHQKLKSGPRSK